VLRALVPHLTGERLGLHAIAPSRLPSRRLSVLATGSTNGCRYGGVATAESYRAAAWRRKVRCAMSGRLRPGVKML
jgi:hypothetical protein